MHVEPCMLSQHAWSVLAQLAAAAECCLHSTVLASGMMIGLLVPSASPPQDAVSDHSHRLALPPAPCRLRIFELFPVLLGIAVTWIIAAIITASGAYNNASASQQQYCKTNNLAILENAPWIRFPYPGEAGR